MSASVAPLRIASFNLFNFLEPPGAFYDPLNIYSQQQWQQKVTWTADLLAMMQPHVVAFQEVFSPEALRSCCHQLGLSYFANMGMPRVEQGYVYSDPVVALASRYPLRLVQQVAPEPALARVLGLDPNFQFSRPPLRACIDWPGFGPIRLYVVHLKSPRPVWEGEGAAQLLPPDAPALQRLSVEHLVLKPALGGWGAAQQRGGEAAMLMLDHVSAQQEEPLPTVIMGDFNDELSSICLQPLLARERLPLLGPLGGKLTLDEAERFTSRFPLRDAFRLAQDGSEIRPTHYWGPVGRRLDHLLMSAEFDPSYGQSMAQVDTVTVFDRHLVRNDPEGDLQCSDHAAVQATLSARR